LIYGSLTETSIGQLFLGGIIPGLLMALCFMAYILVRCLRDRSLYPVEPELQIPFLQKLKSLLSIWPVAGLVFAVMGTIVLGIATPTEAAGVGVVSAIALGFLWGDLTFRKLVDCFRQAAITYGSIGFVVVGAVILAQSISILGVPQALIEAIEELGWDRYWVLLLVILCYVLLGCLFDGLSLMVMTLPIVFPLLTGLGFDPIWLGVIVTILIEIGQVTPPVGLNLSVIVAVTNHEIGLGKTALATVPYWLLLLLGILVLTLFPDLVLYLPQNHF